MEQKTSLNKAPPTNQKEKHRKYQKIWEAIRTNISGKPIVVKCKAGPFQKTLIQGVMKEKAKINAPRKKMDVIGYGELIINRYEDRVEFSLRFNGDNI